MNLYFNNKTQISDSAKQVNTLFILLGCKYVSPDIIQIITYTGTVVAKYTESLCSISAVDVDFSLLLSVLKFSFKFFTRNKHDFTGKY